MFGFEFSREESEDVLVRIFHEESEKMVTIITADYSTIGEDGPVVTQIAEDRVVVIFSNEYVEKKINAAIERNAEEFGEMAFTIGFSFIVNSAMKAVGEKFLTED